MRWTHDDGERAWHRWFAWYPVELWNNTGMTARRAWLEWVERQTHNANGYLIHHHRAIGGVDDPYF